MSAPSRFPAKVRQTPREHLISVRENLRAKGIDLNDAEARFIFDNKRLENEVETLRESDRRKATTIRNLRADQADIREALKAALTKCGQPPCESCHDGQRGYSDQTSNPARDDIAGTDACGDCWGVGLELIQ